MKKTTLYMLMALSAMILTGCGQEPLQTIEQICTPQAGYTQIMDTAEMVLAEMNFKIAKADTEHGFLQTRPLTAAQSFEFWRKDNVGSFNSSEANLHTIRRIIEMQLSEKNGQTCVNCFAYTERMSLPESETLHSGRTASMFTASGRNIQQLSLNPDQAKDMTWIDLGRDNALETEILNRLKARL